jgi:hypothetical protein
MERGRISRNMEAFNSVCSTLLRLYYIICLFMALSTVQWCQGEAFLIVAKHSISILTKLETANQLASDLLHPCKILSLQQTPWGLCCGHMESFLQKAWLQFIFSVSALICHKMEILGLCKSMVCRWGQSIKINRLWRYSSALPKLQQ